MTKFTQTLLASLVTFTAAGAQAAAFQLAEVSTSGLGTAYAGNAAVAENASVVATNPALITKFRTTQISAGGILVDTNVDVNGQFLGRPASQKNVIPTAVVPNLYIVAPITDRFALGGGMNVNYGLKSEYNDNFEAGVYGGRTELTAINLNLSGAYDVGSGFSVGAGLNAIYSKAEVARHLGIGGLALQQRLGQFAAATNNQRLAAIAQQLGQLPRNLEVSRIKGDEWSFGWNAGISYDLNENNRWGLAYHSAVNVKFKGDYRNGFPTAYNALLTQLGATGISLPITQATGGQDVSGRLTLNLPAYWELSGWHKLTDKLSMQYSWKYTEWKRLKSLTAYSEQGNVLFHKEESFSNSSRYSLGFNYDLNEALTLRTGVAYDQNASKKHPSISIPDTDRMWYAVGATYRFTPNLSADVAYAYLKGKKRHFKEGSASFDTKASASLYGLNVNYSF
ncbi:hypothetical protein A4G19_08170 [Pasteurellaceae bacterium Macca]|nr:hypothetical protein [Pasteurellaceae bacterium Macca]